MFSNMFIKGGPEIFSPVLGNGPGEHGNTRPPSHCEPPPLLFSHESKLQRPSSDAVQLKVICRPRPATSFRGAWPEQGGFECWAVLRQDRCRRSLVQVGLSWREFPISRSRPGRALSLRNNEL